MEGAVERVAAKEDEDGGTNEGGASGVGQGVALEGDETHEPFAEGLRVGAEEGKYEEMHEDANVENDVKGAWGTKEVEDVSCVGAIERLQRGHQEEEGVLVKLNQPHV